MLYNSEYFSGQSRWLIKQRSKELEQRFAAAERYFINKTGIKFLDIGTGEGNSLLEGLKRKWEVNGIDIVDNRIEKARKPDIKFHKAKFLEQDFPENYYDYIYLDSVLEHVKMPYEYLLKAKSILKPGGIIYIGIPNEDSLFNAIRRIAFTLTGRKEISEKLKPFDSPYHVTGFNLYSLKFLIDKAGLKIKKLRNFGRKFDFLSYSPKDKGFWISLFFLFPVEILGYLLKKDVYFEVYLTKEK